MRESTHRIADPKIIQQVSQRLAGCGIRAPSRVTVVSSNGEVTLSGTVQYQHQRQAAIRATQAVAGVRRVIDVLNLIATPRRQEPTSPKAGAKEGLSGTEVAENQPR